MRGLAMKELAMRRLAMRGLAMRGLAMRGLAGRESVSAKLGHSGAVPPLAVINAPPTEHFNCWLMFVGSICICVLRLRGCLLMALPGALLGQKATCCAMRADLFCYSCCPGVFLMIVEVVV